MSDAYFIEVWGEPVGIAVTQERGFRLHATTPRLASLDGALFPTLGRARLAAIRSIVGPQLSWAYDGRLAARAEGGCVAR